MKCENDVARYYGRWGTEGFCRDCVTGMPTDLRRRILKDLHPEDSKRWQLDGLAHREKQNPRRVERSDRKPWPEDIDLLFQEKETQTESVDLLALRPASAQPKTSKTLTPRLHSPERRRYPRLPAKLKTQFAVSPHSNATASLRGKVFRSITKDVSLGGVCILVQDVSLLELPFRSHLRIVVAIPQPQSLVRSVGLVRNIVRTVQGTDNGRLCVAFSTMRQGEKEKLKQFIAVQAGI